MNSRKSTVQLWAPRVLTLTFAAFLTIFSLDVFHEGHSAGEIVLNLLAHNLPSLLLLVIVAAAWKRPWIGAAACSMLGTFYIVWAWGTFPLSVYLTISGPLFLAAILYGLNGKKQPAGS